MSHRILNCDYPDPDVIRVGDVYYMLSTTMHFFPGGAVLRSYDLVHWELVNYLYDVLENTAGASSGRTKYLWEGDVGAFSSLF